jgi:predicted RNase H-like HicB family nuclease
MISDKGEAVELPYTYWEDEESGWLLGFLNEWPDDWTQGKNLAELEEMLADILRNQTKGRNRNQD